MLTDADLCAKCLALAPAGDAMAAAVLDLLDRHAVRGGRLELAARVVADFEAEVRRLKRWWRKSRRLNLALADRCAKQSELLSRRAEAAPGG